MNANDHNFISDMMGGAASFNDGWSTISTVPEIPASPCFVLGFAGLVVFGGRLRSLAKSWVLRRAS